MTVAPGVFQPGDDVQTTGMTVWHRIVAVEPVHVIDNIERITYVIAPLSKRGLPALAATRRIDSRALAANLLPDGHRPRQRTFWKGDDT